jgi:hypothetical protein
MADLDDNREPRRTQLHDWANAWTAEVAQAVGGLDISGWHRVRQIIHEVRRRSIADDLSHPGQPASGQEEMAV